MRKLNISMILLIRAIIALILLIFCASCTSCKYMKLDPPPDVDKGPPIPTPPALDNTCWMATASNMLAGAGYGNGTTMQQRAEDIYNDMVVWQTDPVDNPTGKEDGGWTDTAINWWLVSPNNTWTTNPYTIVTVDGYKNPRYPWDEPNGAMIIGNELRRCQFVGLSISWPTTSATIGERGHAITCWGDNGNDGDLSYNPSEVIVTDSDRDTGGDVQTYSYDVYTNPNPGGPNEGNGWYFDFDPIHPYIKHIITLCPTDDPSDNKLTQRVTGSYKIHQSNKLNATDLHYKVGTDVNILSYKTTIDWSTENSPVIVESNPRRTLTVDWDLLDKPVPYCTWITITTEFILPNWNAIKYNNVHFTYPKRIEKVDFPSINWEIKSPRLVNADTILHVTGGYLVGSFNIITQDSLNNKKKLAEYRFVHEYNFNQSPELHEFYLSGSKGYLATNLKFGHSYGYPSKRELWNFKNWMTMLDEKDYPLDEKPINISIDWKGQLPYPEGEYYKGRRKK